MFGAQLTIGNTSFTSFLVSRDPYNIARGSGSNAGGHGRWMAIADRSVPPSRSASMIAAGFTGSAPESVTVSAVVSGEEPAALWRVIVEGEPCRFLVFCNLALGEHEYAHAAYVEIDASQKRFTFRPSADDTWGQHIRKPFITS